MWAVLKTFSKPILSYLSAFVAAAALILFVRKSGKDAVRADNLTNHVKVTGEAHEVRRETASTPDSAVLNELRSEWSRQP